LLAVLHRAQLGQDGSNKAPHVTVRSENFGDCPRKYDCIDKQIVTTKLLDPPLLCVLLVPDCLDCAAVVYFSKRIAQAMLANGVGAARILQSGICSSACTTRLLEAFGEWIVL
jgi:hypothetical protein